MAVKIIGAGSYIPKGVTRNEEFENNQFLNQDGSQIGHENIVIIEKFKSITGIAERRYAEDSLDNSDIGCFAAQEAIKDANIDQEEIDYIIVAHNYGDIKYGTIQTDAVPSIASRIKHKLRIQNPHCVAYDILFGCPGWIEGMIQANAYIKSGMAKKCLVIGTETLSRIIDQHDRDSMIYSDGAGAAIVEYSESDSGILHHESLTFTLDEANFIYFGESYNQEQVDRHRYIKMYGRKVYEFAIRNVPAAMKSCLDNSGIDISEVKKVFIHQANEKMDEAIIQRFYKLYDKTPPKDIMPMSINKLGNSSVATVPTLYDLVLKQKLDDHRIETGDIVILASVGAGMNINAIIYRV
jgi:3-oxoacyl-[acyl-carrier-protein] synthase-3